MEVSIYKIQHVYPDDVIYLFFIYPFLCKKMVAHLRHKVSCHVLCLNGMFNVLHLL